MNDLAEKHQRFHYECTGPGEKIIVRASLLGSLMSMSVVIAMFLATLTM